MGLLVGDLPPMGGLLTAITPIAILAAIIAASKTAPIDEQLYKPESKRAKEEKAASSYLSERT
jgi:hypothetical protein